MSGRGKPCPYAMGRAKDRTGEEGRALDKEKTCCFTGHRPDKLPWGEKESDPRCRRLKESIAQAAEEAYESGIRHFISGMAVGFDLAAAEAVIELRSRCGDVTLECAVPYEGFERGFSPEDAERFGRIVAEADTVNGRMW